MVGNPTLTCWMGSNIWILLSSKSVTRLHEWHSSWILSIIGLSRQTVGHKKTAQRESRLYKRFRSASLLQAFPYVDDEPALDEPALRAQSHHILGHKWDSRIFATILPKLKPEFIQIGIAAAIIRLQCWFCCPPFVKRKADHQPSGSFGICVLKRSQNTGCCHS